MFPTNGECLIGIFLFFVLLLLLFCLLFTDVRHLVHVLTVPPTKACLLCATSAGMDLSIQVHDRRHLPSAVPWISEDRLLALERRHMGTTTRNAWSSCDLASIRGNTGYINCTKVSSSRFGHFLTKRFWIVHDIVQSMDKTNPKLLFVTFVCIYGK